MFVPFNFEPVGTVKCMCNKLTTHRWRRLHNLLKNYRLPLPTIGSMTYISPNVTTAKPIACKAPTPTSSTTFKNNSISRQAPNRKKIKKVPLQRTYYIKKSSYILHQKVTHLTYSILKNISYTLYWEILHLTSHILHQIIIHITSEGIKFYVLNYYILPPTSYILHWEYCTYCIKKYYVLRLTYCIRKYYILCWKKKLYINYYIRKAYISQKKILHLTSEGHKPYIGKPYI